MTSLWQTVDVRTMSLIAGHQAPERDPFEDEPAADNERGRDLSMTWAGARLRLMLLRAFDLTYDGATIRVSAGAQRVLAFLALSDRPLARSYVAGVLWPETSDKRASGSLRSAVWDLRLTGHDLVETSGHCLQLGPAVQVDYRWALMLAEAVLDARRPCPDAYLERDLLRGDLLSDWYDDWVLFERERFRQLRLHILEALCDRLIEERRFARAVEAGVAAVAGEPLRETAHRALIQAHLAEGNLGEALRQYETYERLLRDDLGLVPSQELRALIRRMARPQRRAGGTALSGRPDGTLRPALVTPR